MPEDQEKPDTHEIGAQPVPTGRVSRLARFGGLASGIAGNMALNGARQLVQGQRPDWSELLLSPANAHKLAGQLAQMRCAAMKVGQIMSMDSGAILPPEFVEVLARLRSDAHAIAPSTVEKSARRELGPPLAETVQKI